MQIIKLDRDTGYILDDALIHIFEKLKFEIQKENLPKANEDLAGNIQNEY